MRTPAILGLTLFLSCPLPAAMAQIVPTERIPRAVDVGAEFRSDEEFLRWVTNYYRDPQPREVPRAFVYFIDSGLMRDEAKRMPIAAFFGGALRERPEIADALREQIKARREYDPLFALSNALWLTNADWARQTLREMAAAEQNEQVSIFLTRRAQAASPIGEGRELRSLMQLETLWGEFGATGNPRLPERVAEVLLIEFDPSPDALILQQAAEQSLRLRAREHEPVRAGMRAAIEKAVPSPRRDALEKLLAELTPPPAD